MGFIKSMFPESNEPVDISQFDLAKYISNQINKFREEYPSAVIESFEVVKGEDGQYNLVVTGKVQADIFINRLIIENEVAVLDELDAFVFKGTKEEAWDYLTKNTSEGSKFLVYIPWERNFTSRDMFVHKYEMGYYAHGFGS